MLHTGPISSTGGIFFWLKGAHYFPFVIQKLDLPVSRHAANWAVRRITWHVPWLDMAEAGWMGMLANDITGSIYFDHFVETGNHCATVAGSKTGNRTTGHGVFPADLSIAVAFCDSQGGSFCYQNFATLQNLHIVGAP